VTAVHPLSTEVAPTDADVLRWVYRLAVLTRAVDERLWVLSRQGSVSFVLTARGHEIAQIATAATLRRGHDSAWPYYRDMGVGFALGVTPYEEFMGAMGRADDPHSGARQLTTHLSSPVLKIGSISSAIAAQIPHAVGAAYAAKVLGEDRVAMTWFGDGAASEGYTHEAMNLAAVHKLPVVFVCENNGIAISVPQRLQMAVDSIASRADAYGMVGVRVDGCDALRTYRAAREAVERARRGDGPTLIETVVPRITAHSSQDEEAYRSDDDRRDAEARDPLPRLRAELLERGLLSVAEDDELARQARRSVLADADRALAEPSPAPDRARRWLFAGDSRHPGLAALDAAGIPRGALGE
jgi:2-oxoisovalerate dehydrogenase E1 component alpha subunit